MEDDKRLKRVYSCRVRGCNKKYGKISHLRTHLRWHSGEWYFVCNWGHCIKNFWQSDELMRHKRTHTGYTGEKRFECKDCHKHMKTQEPGTSSSNPEHHVKGEVTEEADMTMTDEAGEEIDDEFAYNNVALELIVDTVNSKQQVSLPNGESIQLYNSV